METDQEKRQYGKLLIDNVPAELLEDMIWALQQFAAPGMNAK